MSQTATLPGVAFTTVAPAVDTAALRSDVAGFAGRTRRGPVAQRLRIEGWNDYLRRFGGLDAEAFAPYGLRGYFENGGQVAHVVRVGDAALDHAHTAFVELAPFGPYGGYRIEASSPGAWANRTRVRLRFRRDGASGHAELDLAVDAPGEPPEYFAALPIGQLDEDGADLLQKEVARRSALVRMVPAAAAIPAAAPRWLDWQLVLNGGVSVARLDAASYSAALQLLADEPEVALVAAPDLQRDVGPDAAAVLLADALVLIDSLRDRLLLIDAPADSSGSNSVASSTVLAWIDALRGMPPSLEARSAAAYHPWLSVADPLGGSASPLKNIPPSGHVAGVISRLDRERGPHHTPANAPLRDAYDIAARLNGEEAIGLNGGAVNLLRCRPGDGLQVWGGSTLASVPGMTGLNADHFIAYRRLIHRLVRAIRRVAEPLVFDVNGPPLWLAFVRAVSTVLLEAWRGGALKGERPAEAFQVQCDERNNPPEARDLGLCVCDISVAPVAPMEFIVFRVALNGEGTLEVFES